MGVAELVEGVQFTVNQEGRVIAAVIEPSLWQRIVEALEDAEDRELVQTLQARLFDGPAGGGTLRWQDIAHANFIERS